MKKLRIVFYVDDPGTKEMVVEKSQAIFELSEEDMAVDPIGVGPDPEPTAASLKEFQERVKANNRIMEIVEASMGTMMRFAKLKVQEWAKKQREQV